MLNGETAVARCSVFKSPDGLFAYVNVPGGSGGAFPPAEEILRSLSDNGVVFGVDREKVDSLVRNRLWDTRFEVACGNPPKPGVAARIEHLVDVSKSGKPRQKTDGSVDHYDLQIIINVRAGDPLAKRIPPVPGEKGTDVTGKTIVPPPPADARLLAGPGTVIASADPDLLVAAIDGALTVSPEGRIEVRSEKLISGDIDYATGNISFAGSLKINGAVRAGFQVSTEGNVLITGAVEDAVVTSKCSIEILGGAAGGGKGRLAALRDVKVRYIENFSAAANHDIVVSEDAVQCKLFSRGFIRARSVIGGVATVGKGVEAENLGNQAEVKTVIDLGGQLEVIKKKDEALRRLAHLVTEIGLAKETMFSLVRESMDESGVMPSKTIVRFNVLKAKKCEHVQEYESTQKKIQELAEAERNITTPVIKVKRLYPNTVVRYGTAEKLFAGTLTGVVIFPENGTFTVNRG